MNVNRSHWLRLLVVGWVLAAATRPGQALMISEIMYHPVDERLEFIELHNPRAVVEDLGGFVLTGAVEYVFEPDVTLAAGATLAVALDPEALGEVYDVPQLLGPYTTIKTEELPEYYRQRNLLKARVYGHHVGNAVVFFASNATPTTGATLPVDGGVAEAFPR